MAQFIDVPEKWVGELRKQYFQVRICPSVTLVLPFCGVLRVFLFLDHSMT